MEDNNMSAEASYLRDTFLTAEREYVLFLLKDKKIRNLIEELNMYDGKELFKVAQKLVDDVEMGIIPEEQMEIIEKQLIVLLAAIRDLTLRKKLVLHPSHQDKQSNGRSR